MSLSGNVHAANSLMKIVQQVEDKDIPDDSFYAKDRTLKIVTVSSREENERLASVRKALEDKFGKDYEQKVVEEELDMEEGF
jgi:hypothetical protein